jgi:signal transduction histidine kinase
MRCLQPADPAPSHPDEKSIADKGAWPDVASGPTPPLWQEESGVGRLPLPAVLAAGQPEATDTITAWHTLAQPTAGGDVVPILHLPRGYAPSAADAWPAPEARVIRLRRLPDRDPGSQPATPSAAENALLLEVAHDLRGRLQALEFTLSGLVERVVGTEGDVEHLVQGLQRSAVHLQTLLENLLDAASIGVNRLHLHLEWVDLATVVEEAVLAVEPLLSPRGHTIEVGLPEGSLPVMGDLHRLRQVVVNLLHNAIKYGPRDAVIRVHATRAPSTVRLAVSDPGGTIPPEEQPRLFERFYRGSAAKGGRGSGLGLAISRSIVEAHGGTIGVESAPGAGTTFWFTVHAG